MTFSRLPLMIIPISMCIHFCSEGIARNRQLPADSLPDFPSAYFSKVQNKNENLEDRISEKTEICLRKLFSREKKLLSQVNQLQGKLQQAEQVKIFIQQRKQHLTESLGRYTNLPNGIVNEFNIYQKQAYYYHT